MGEILDVVALDNQSPPGYLDFADAGRAAGLVQVPLIKQGVSLLKHRQHGRFFFTANGAQGKCAALHGEQRAVAANLDQVIPESPVAHLVDLFLQRLQRQRMLAVAQQVIHQQFFGERFE